MDRGFFTAEFYADNYLTRVITAEPATVFTGFWPMVLGLLLVTAGFLFLFNLQRIARWATLAVGACATVVAAVSILMIQNRLGEGVPVEYGLWMLLGVGLATFALGAMLELVAILRPRGKKRGDTQGEEVRA